MLSPTSSTFRLFLHVFAACVWVGGQIVLAGLIPVVRRYEGATKIAARAFNRIASPAFGVLVLTGIWNLMEVDINDAPTSYQVTVFVKIAVAIVAGAAVAVHVIGESKAAKAAGGAIGLLASLAALFLGILLRTGS
jgi:putative copper export protein